MVIAGKFHSSMLEYCWLTRSKVIDYREALYNSWGNTEWTPQSICEYYTATFKAWLLCVLLGIFPEFPVNPYYESPAWFMIWPVIDPRPVIVSSSQTFLHRHLSISWLRQTRPVKGISMHFYEVEIWWHCSGFFSVHTCMFVQWELIFTIFFCLTKNQKLAPAQEPVIATIIHDWLYVIHTHALYGLIQLILCKAIFSACDWTKPKILLLYIFSWESLAI